MTTIINFTIGNKTYTFNPDTKYYGVKEDKGSGVVVNRKISKAAFELAQAEYNTPAPEPKDEPKPKATTRAIKKGSGPIVWTNITDKKGATMYCANGLILYAVERINKGRTASIYIHSRLNSTLGEANGNKNSKYSRRLRGNVDEVFHLVNEEARAWAQANLVEA